MLEMTMLVIMLAQHTDHRRPRRCKKMSPTQSVVLKSHASAGLLHASDKSSPKSPQGHWRQWTYSSITRDNNKTHQCKQESWTRNLKLLKTLGEEFHESPHSTIRVIQYSGSAISLVWPPNQPNSCNVSRYNPSTGSTIDISYIYLCVCVLPRCWGGKRSNGRWYTWNLGGWRCKSKPCPVDISHLGNGFWRRWVNPYSQETYLLKHANDIGRNRYTLHRIVTMVFWVYEFVSRNNATLHHLLLPRTKRSKLSFPDS